MVEAKGDSCGAAFDLEGSVMEEGLGTLVILATALFVIMF